MTTDTAQTSSAAPDPAAPVALTQMERAARARATLARAEQLTGARSLHRPDPRDTIPAPRGSDLRGSGLHGSDPRDSVVRTSAPPDGHRQRGARSQQEARALSETQALSETRMQPDARTRASAEVSVRSFVLPPDLTRQASLVTSERPALPVPEELATLLPDGLRRGSTVAVLGSTSLVLSLLAEACSNGAWAAVVGQPTVGLLAAAQAGVALERLAVIPRPGLESPTVVAALVDGIDVVLVGPGAVLTDGERRRLVSRARERGAVLLASAPWPGANVVLSVEQGRWSGAGEGDGRLQTHELRVTRSGRAGAAVRRSVELTLPLPRPGTRRDRATVVADGTAGAGAGAVPSAVPEVAPAPLRLVG